MRTPYGGLSSTTAWRALAAALVLAGVFCLLMWSDRSTPTESADPIVATTPPATDTSGDQRPSRAGPAPRPVRLSIPSLGVTSRLVGLALQPDGTVEVPQDPALAGWYRLGPPPGAVGSAVILGHVDSVEGPAVFYRLDELGPGDRITVRLDDGSTVRFAVRSITTYLNADFPAQRVYGSHGRRELRLITCGGAYDADRGGYQANVVVNARRVAPAAA